MELQYHAVSSTSTSRFKPCIQCVYIVDTGEDFSLIGPNALNNLLVTKNGSYILPNGIIVLVDEDIILYHQNTLVFYYKKEETI